MKIKRRIYLTVTVIMLSIICFVTGCGNVQLSDVEQLIYDCAKEHGSASSKVELDTVFVYSFKDGVDEELTFGDNDPDEGQYIILTGVVLWDNGAKDDLMFKYTIEKDGQVKSEDLTSTANTGMSSALDAAFNNYYAALFERELIYYKRLILKGRTISFEEYKNGELGYISIDDDSLNRINKALAKK